MLEEGFCFFVNYFGICYYCRYIIDDFDDKFDITEECDKYLQNEERTLRKKLEIERREKDIV